MGLAGLNLLLADEVDEAATKKRANACLSSSSTKLHSLLLLNRKQSVEEGYAPAEERAAIGLWKWSMQHRWALDLLPVQLKDWSLGRLLGQVGWSKRRASLHIGGPSFRQLWQARPKR